MIGDDQLRDLAPLISMVWLFDILPRMLEPATIPTLHNADGEEVVFHRVRFPSRVARRRLCRGAIPSRRCNGKQPISGTGSGRNQHRARKAPAGWHGRDDGGRYAGPRNLELRVAL
jgi:hypothetical protein